ncbi:MAG: hypothetical protein CME83_02070 [Candidatus Heimdallarchaeota archaeon]|nr:hypothetical protein [Candidatus Heimdallarchaeota archaeon]
MGDLIILIDTNVLYHSDEYGIRIQDDVTKLIEKKSTIYVHSMVQSEILRDLTKNDKRARYAKFAMELINNFEQYEDDRIYDGTDVAILKTAKRVNGIVFTYDKKLKERCKKINVPVITNFRKGKLQLLGHVW